jgi:hypothetical protein
MTLERRGRALTCRFVAKCRTPPTSRARSVFRLNTERARRCARTEVRPEVLPGGIRTPNLLIRNERGRTNLRLGSLTERLCEVADEWPWLHGLGSR